MWIHWPFFPKTWTKGHWPQDDLWPQVCWGHMCDSTQGSLCQVPRKYLNVDTVTLFSKKKKKMNQRSLTPRWPLTQCLLRSHVWLYQRIIVSKSHKNTSKYVGTVTLFSKTWTIGHWPLDDLWPHVCWGHMCDSTQGSLCPSPMRIQQYMWIQWSIMQYYHILHTYILCTYYILHTTYRMSIHIVSYWTQFRQEKNACPTEM